MEVFKHKTTPKKTTSQPSTIAHQKKEAPTEGENRRGKSPPTRGGRAGKKRKQRRNRGEAEEKRGYKREAHLF